MRRLFQCARRGFVRVSHGQEAMQEDREELTGGGAEGEDHLHTDRFEDKDGAGEVLEPRDLHKGTWNGRRYNNWLSRYVG